MPRLFFLNTLQASIMNASKDSNIPMDPGTSPGPGAPPPPINHDWIFKNLVQDYPQAALAFFAADEHIGLDDDIEITFLGQEPPETDMTEGKLILDMPIRVRWRDGSREDLIILLEEETVPSRFNPERLLVRIPMIVTDDSGIVTAQSGHRDRCRVVRDIACQANCTIA